MSPEMKNYLKSYGVASIIATLTCFSLNFAALSPLIIGEIISFVSAHSLAALITSAADNLEHYEKTRQTKQVVHSLCTLATTVAVGIGLGAAIGTIFPAVMLNIESAALMSVTIGVIAPVVSLVAFGLLVLTTEKIDECIIEPTFEKIEECFSSKGA